MPTVPEGEVLLKTGESIINNITNSKILKDHVVISGVPVTKVGKTILAAASRRFKYFEDLEKFLNQNPNIIICQLLEKTVNVAEGPRFLLRYFTSSNTGCGEDYFVLKNQFDKQILKFSLRNSTGPVRIMNTYFKLRGY